MSSAVVTSRRAVAQRDKRVPEFDGLRGVLAWLLVLVHVTICCGWFGPNFNGQSLLSEVAESALNLFFLLSGFAITRLLVVQREPFNRYMWRRVCRIVPPYWVALTAAIALNSWLAANLQRLPSTPDTQGLIMICDIAAARVWIDSALHYTLLHGLAPVPLLPWAPFTFLGAAWSLSLEWQFYCIAPFVLALAVRSRIALTLLILLGAVGLAFADYWMHWFTVAFIGIKGGLILAGALTFFVASRGEKLGVLLVPAYVAAALWGIGSGRAVEALVTSAGWTIVIVAAYSDQLRFASRFLNSAPLQYLGRVSYSTYLFHVPVIIVLQRAIWNLINPADRLQLFGWTLAGAISGTLVVSELSWRFIEHPFLEIGRVRRAGVACRN